MSFFLVGLAPLFAVLLYHVVDLPSHSPFVVVVVLVVFLLAAHWVLGVCGYLVLVRVLLCQVVVGCQVPILLAIPPVVYFV